MGSGLGLGLALGLGSGLGLPSSTIAASPQKVYPPCASSPGVAPMPPS